VNSLGEMLKALEHKRLSNSTAAVAGLATAVSVLVGAIAAHFAPHGWLRIASALHLHRQPMIVRMAPLVAGVAAGLATAASLVKFYSWCIEREESSSAQHPREPVGSPDL
jgi:hypothetical protein